MTLLLLTVGTRGDVQPFLALAWALQQRGQQVRLAAPKQFAPLAQALHVPFAPLSADYLDLASTPEGQAAIRGNPIASWQLLQQVVLPSLRALLAEATRAAQGCSGLVFHPKALAGRHLAEALEVPAYLVELAPLIVPSRFFPSAILSAIFRQRALAGPLNALSYRMSDLAEAPLRGVLREWRRELGLPAAFSPSLRQAGGRVLPSLQAYSRFLQPPPPDWDSSTSITGFWTLPAEQTSRLSEQTEAFLAAGSAPIYIGFGSMGAAEGELLATKMLRVLRRLKLRAIFQGFAALPNLLTGPDVLTLSSSSHARLFARVAAVVHHGGAGTTAASLLAGRPSVVVPHGLDQPYWGQRLQEVGAGACLPLASLSERQFEAALKQALSQSAQQHARALAALMADEQGAERAAQLLIRALAQPRSYTLGP